MAERLVALFVGCWLIAQPHPATDSEGAWLAVGDRGIVLWEFGKAVGLVAPVEKSWAFTQPMRGGSGLVADYKTDLNKLRERAKCPKAP